jgi:hypothetical protein
MHNVCTQRAKVGASRGAEEGGTPLVAVVAIRAVVIRATVTREVVVTRVEVGGCP